MMKTFIKYIATYLLRILLNVFNIFKIRNNRILFYSFNGKQYSCNPRQISEYLNANYPEKFEIIWAVRNPEKFKYIIPDNVKVVKYRSLTYYYFAKTSHIIVQNVQGFGELARRSKQKVIQTWHASNGYKKQGEVTGLDRKLELLYHKDYSYVMSGSESMTERRVRGSMGFQGEVISGTPRMDIIINHEHPEYKKKVFQYLNIETGKKLLLYAPTWRKNRNDNDYGLDYAELKKALEKRFGCDWIIAVRLHPNVNKKLVLNNDYLRDATDYPDMEELLYVADCLVSDYSSCIWDYSFTKRPCFLFCNDIEKYGQDRDFDIPISKWHFPVATNVKEFVNLIQTFDENAYLKDLSLHHLEMHNLEDGNATNRICSLIYRIVFGEE